MAVAQQSNLYYDIAAVKDIPILTAAELLGVPVQKRGKNYWCKIRQEKNPSVILHPDRNTFYDFGNQVHGDVIRFAQYAQDLNRVEAIRFLAEAYGMEPTLTRQELMDRPLTNWEYKKIGLYGDMASKNITFPIEDMTLPELCEMSQYYQMPLNELKKKEPGVYRGLIQKTSIPYVSVLRNSYFLEVWNHFHLCYAMGDNSINLFRAHKVRKRFEKETKFLNSAERVLYRACKNAGIKMLEPERHDPVNVIRQLLHGELAIMLGNISGKDLFDQANRVGCRVCQADIPFYSYFEDSLLKFSHAAQYKAGKVTVQYLSHDIPEIQPILEELQKTPDRALEQRIRKVFEKNINSDPDRKENMKNQEIHEMF